MQIDQIRSFVRCAELGSLSVAAKAEGVPKSSLSRMLAQLERHLDVELLNRTSRGVTLTQNGRVFLVHARQILESIDTARAAVQHRTSTPSGTIRFTAPYTFGATFIAPLLPTFFSAFPLIKLHVELTSRNVDFAAEGYDVGIRIGPPPVDLVARRIMGNPILLGASVDHIARCGMPSSPEELTSHPLLLIGKPRSTTLLRLWRDGLSHLVPTPAKVISTDPVIILRSTLAGVGIGQIPVILARDEIAKGDLVPVLPEWSMPEADISIIYPAGRALTPPVRAFVDFLCQALSSSP